MSTLRAHIERRTQGKYPAVPYIAVVVGGEVIGTFNDNMDHALIYQAGFNTGAEKQAMRSGRLITEAEYMAELEAHERSSVD